MDILAAQKNVQDAYVCGIPGVFVSGLAWLVAGAIWTQNPGRAAFTVLFIGGIFIFPASLLIARLVFKAPPVIRDNPLSGLGFETTIMLFAGIFIAWLTLPVSDVRAFAFLAIVMGARYFSFATLYRDKSYWLLGGIIMAIGAVHALGHGIGALNIALAVGVTEIVVSAVMLVRRNARSR